MKQRSETFPDFECETSPPQIPDAVVKGLDDLKTDGATVHEQALKFMDDLKERGFNRTQIAQMTIHLFPRAKATRLASSVKAQAAEVEKLEKKAEVEKCLVRMEQGNYYSNKDILAMLPPQSQFLAIKTERGRLTAIGYCLTALVREGKLVKVKDRHASYSLPVESQGGNGPVVERERSEL